MADAANYGGEVNNEVRIGVRQQPFDVIFLDQIVITAAWHGHLHAGILLLPVNHKPAQKTGSTSHNNALIRKFCFTRVHAREHSKNPAQRDTVCRKTRLEL